MKKNRNFHKFYKKSKNILILSKAFFKLPQY